MSGNIYGRGAAGRCTSAEVSRRLAVVVTSACVLLASCGGDGDANRELSADEGAALLEDIRDRPDRAQTLSISERRYVDRILNRPPRSNSTRGPGGR